MFTFQNIVYKKVTKCYNKTYSLHHATFNVAFLMAKGRNSFNTVLTADMPLISQVFMVL